MHIVCSHSFWRIFRHSFLFLPSQLHCSSPSFHQNTGPKWLTPSFFNMRPWRHPGRAEVLCMHTKMIHILLSCIWIVESCPAVKWYYIQMPFEYRTKFCPIFRPPFEYWTSFQMVVWIPHHNTGHLKRTRKFIIQMFVIQIFAIPPLYLYITKAITKL